MTGNKERLDDFQAFHGRKVTFGGGEGRITEKICDKKNQVLFTDTECLILSKDFKLPYDNIVVLKVPRKHNIYTITLNDLCPRGNFACLVAHASFDESVKWHRRMAHVNYKNMNRIKREYNNPRTPQQNRVTEKKNRTLIEAARTMLADSKLPTMFWTEAVRTACYVLNRVLVTSPYNKTPYALLTGNIPSVSHFKPFGCHVTILNTSDYLSKFDGKADEGYIVGYSASNKAYKGLGHEWYFDLDYLTDSLGYKHVSANQPTGTQGTTTNSAGTQDVDSDSDCDEQVIIVPSYPSHSIQGTQPIDTPGDKVYDSLFSSTDAIFQKELARLKGAERRDTSSTDSPALGTANNAENLQTPPSAQPVPPGCIPVPTSNVPVPTGSLPVPTGSIPIPVATTMVPTDDFPVHSSSLTDSIFDSEPTIRFP
nr:retrovirus-related Pol polyprotein from transposon TNT 1-94 [Tanacetum cinerariifolium]